MVIQKQLFFNYYFMIFNYFNKKSNKKFKKGVEKNVRKLQNRAVF